MSYINVVHVDHVNLIKIIINIHISDIQKYGCQVNDEILVMSGFFKKRIPIALYVYAHNLNQVLSDVG